MNEAQVVHAARQIWQEAADPRPRLPVTLECVHALHEVSRLSEESEILALSLEALAIHAFELGLVVERFEVADAAGTEHLDDPLRAGRVVRLKGRSRGRAGGTGIACEQPGQGNSREAIRGAREPLASRSQGALRR